MALSSKIQALINYANETTGAGDTRLGDAVKTLCDGYGGGGGNEGYQEVEYLESNGSQFITLNFGFSPTDVVDTKFAVLSGTSDKYVVSPITWNNSNNRYGLGVQNGAYTAAFGAMASGSCKLVPTTTYNTDLVTWHYENRLFEVKEKGLSFDTSTITFGNDTALLRLFYGYNANTVARLSHYFHYKNDGTKVELVACYRRADRKPGLYDLVSGTFYTNDGLSEFVVGQETDEHNLPGSGGRKESIVMDSIVASNTNTIEVPNPRGVIPKLFVLIAQDDTTRPLTSGVIYRINEDGSIGVSYTFGVASTGTFGGVTNRPGTVTTSSITALYRTTYPFIVGVTYDYLIVY